jgi:hypothetical protein
MSASRIRRPSSPKRDQRESAFVTILARAVRNIPGARGAALVDSEGETVDYAGAVAPFSLRVAAAHWRIVLDEVNRQRSMHSAQWVAIRASRRGFLVHQLPQGYALVIQFARAAGLVGWRRAVAACVFALGEEAGWPKRRPAWLPLDVATDERRRPLTVITPRGPRSLEILGSLAGGLRARERGWRVRFESGVEATLVREPGGAWYSDELPEPPQRGRQQIR